MITFKIRHCVVPLSSISYLEVTGESGQFIFIVHLHNGKTFEVGQSWMKDTFLELRQHFQIDLDKF